MFGIHDFNITGVLFVSLCTCFNQLKQLFLFQTFHIDMYIITVTPNYPSNKLLNMKY